MKKKRQIIMVMPVMKGGGAERVASLLMNEFAANGYDTEFVLACCNQDEALPVDLKEETRLSFLRQEMKKETLVQKGCYGFLRVLSSLICKVFEAFHVAVPAFFAYLSFLSEYHKEIEALRKKLKANPEATVISFLQPTIPITLLAAKGLPNRVIVSERGNPQRLMKSRYGRKFIEKYYQRADAMVFQTQMAKDTYPANIAQKGTVICNPLKEGLPEAYHGERNKNITTFCRISKQKNLPLLVDAFALIHKEFPDYRLRIIGDSINQEGDQVLQEVRKQIDLLQLNEFVDFEPFCKNIHEVVLKDAMYVNSSDYEGISNAMLEAMAIGMPVVCTDCPVGGAAATIKHEVNGLIVPMKDALVLYGAMKNVIENVAFSNILSINAAKLRDELSISIIAKRWIALF